MSETKTVTQKMSVENATNIESRLSRLETMVSNLVDALHQDRDETRRLWKHFDDVSSQLSNVGKTDWKAILTGVSILLAVLVPTVSASFAFIVYTNTQISSLLSNVNSITQQVESNKQAVSSLRDKLTNDLSNHLLYGGHPETILEIERLRSTVRERVNEIDTQLSALGERINDSIADRHRTDEILWSEVFPGKEYPDTVYWVRPPLRSVFDHNERGVSLPPQNNGQ